MPWAIVNKISSKYGVSNAVVYSAARAGKIKFRERKADDGYAMEFSVNSAKSYFEKKRRRKIAQVTESAPTGPTFFIGKIEEEAPKKILVEQPTNGHTNGKNGHAVMTISTPEPKPISNKQVWLAEGLAKGYVTLAQAGEIIKTMQEEEKRLMPHLDIAFEHSFPA